VTLADLLSLLVLWAAIALLSVADVLVHARRVRRG
jgi:hypothetical protein